MYINAGKTDIIPLIYNNTTVQMHNLSFNEIITFSPEEYPFDKLVLDALRGTLRRMKKSEEISHLSRLHDFIQKTEFRPIEDAIYQLFADIEFQEMYDRLCCEIVEARYDCRVAYQHTPSVRIHMPGAKSVNYHTDEWYGHGHNVNNYWLPLVPVDGANSMYVLNEAVSKELESNMKIGRKSIEEMNASIQPHATALAMNLGEIYCFNSHILHGTVVNNTDSTRISFDFRMLPDGCDPGEKSDSFFILPGTRHTNPVESKQKNRAGLYFGMGQGVSGNISQKYQQLVCLRYAADHGLAALALETELSGFSHHPQLRNMISGTFAGAFDVILIFSVSLLPSDSKERTHLLDEATRSQLPLHCVCEDFVWLPGQSKEKFDEYFPE